MTGRGGGSGEGGGDEGRGTGQLPAVITTIAGCAFPPAAKIQKIGQNTAEYDELMEMLVCTAGGAGSESRSLVGSSTKQKWRMKTQMSELR